MERHPQGQLLGSLHDYSNRGRFLLYFQYNERRRAFQSGEVYIIYLLFFVVVELIGGLGKYTITGCITAKRCASITVFRFEDNVITGHRAKVYFITRRHLSLKILLQNNDAYHQAQIQSVIYFLNDLKNGL